MEIAVRKMLTVFHESALCASSRVSCESEISCQAHCGAAGRGHRSDRPIQLPRKSTSQGSRTSPGQSEMRTVGGLAASLFPNCRAREVLLTTRWLPKDILTSLYAKHPLGGDTAHGMSRGRVVTSHVTPPYGRSVGQPPCGGCLGSPRATHETTPVEGREAWNTRSGPPGGVWHTQARHTSSRIRALWGDREA